MLNLIKMKNFVMIFDKYNLKGFVFNVFIDF